MQESGKAYLNGQPVDFSEFRVDPDFIREFITTPKAPEDEDTEDAPGAKEEDDQNALIAACVKKALEDAERKTETTNAEDKPMHPYDVPERLIKGPRNPLVMLADVGTVPKDYRSRLLRRALAESSEPTLTPSELMKRIRSRESRAGGSQWRLHIPSPWGG